MILQKLNDHSVVIWKLLFLFLGSFFLSFLSFFEFRIDWWRWSRLCESRRSRLGICALFVASWRSNQRNCCKLGVHNFWMFCHLALDTKINMVTPSMRSTLTNLLQPLQLPHCASRICFSKKISQSFLKSCVSYRREGPVHEVVQSLLACASCLRCLSTTWLR